MSTILIRQIPDDYADSTGLSKYNRSRMPGCKDRFSAALNPDGRYNTGLDEKSFLVPKDDKEKIEALRKSLEEKTGKNLDALSEFWENFYITIESDKPRIFNLENPMDKIGFQLLVANRYVAPTFDAIKNPDYRDAQYYAYTEEMEDAEEISNRKKRDEAIGQLMTISDNKDALLLYGQYLEGLKYIDKLSEGTLYKMLRVFIEDKNIENAINFIKALKKSPEELQQKVIIDRAFKQRLIVKTFVAKGKYVYQYGQVTLGNSVEEVYRNLTLPDYTSELMSIKTELEKR